MEFTKEARQCIEDWLAQVTAHTTLASKDRAEVEKELRSSLYDRSEAAARDRGAATVTPEDVRRACAEDRTPEEIAACYTKTYAAGLRRAGFWLKTGAYALDLASIFVLFIGAVIIDELFRYFLKISPLESEPFGILVFLGLPFCYFVLLEGCFGRTVGKYLLGLRVLKGDGTKIGFKEAFLRNLTAGIAIPFFIAGDILIMLLFFPRERQRAFDVVADTIVVKLQSPSEVAGAVSESLAQEKLDRMWTPGGRGGRKMVGGLRGHLLVTAKIALLIVVIFLAYLIAFVPLWLAYGAYEMLTAGTSLARSFDALAEPASLLLYTLMVMLQSAVYVTVILLFQRVVEKQPLLPNDPAGKILSRSIKWFVAGALLYGVIATIWLTIVLGTGVSNGLTDGFSAYSSATMALSVALTLIISLSTAIGEEVIFRKYLQGHLLRNYGRAIALLATSLLFTFQYLVPQPGLQPHGLLYYLSWFTLSLLAGYLYVVTGSVWSCIGCHFLYDAVLFNIPLAGQVYPGVAPLLLVEANDLVILNVSLGSQIYLAGIIVSLAALAGLYVYHRKTGAAPKPCEGA